jgi:SAM-dependent methyltransferase
VGSQTDRKPDFFSLGGDDRVTMKRTTPLPNITWTHPGIVQILDSIPVGAGSLLDVGCGRGIIGALCRIYRGMNRQVGTDGFASYVEFCREQRFYDEVIEHELDSGGLPFDTAEFDVVTCIEVIEHLTTEAGEALVTELERVGKTVILTTPTSFFEQESLDDNPLQHHRSHWRPGYFKRRGYKVTGAGGLKVFGRHVPWVSSAFAPFVRYAPDFSEIMLCKRTGP